MSMIELVVRQQDSHLGFSTAHKGIFDEEKIYEGAVGPIPLLRKSLMEFCDRLEENRNNRIDMLQQIVSNHLLTQKIRTEAQEELERQTVARDDDLKLAHKMRVSKD
ncbi:MAG: hypothetical protein HYT93_02640 [Parcubacteria group bacterium]|nr:hypothetical protein [Parcubacteria group bacterium]